MKKIAALSLILIIAYSSGYSQAKTYDFPRPVDTTDKEIEKQVKGVFELNSTLFSDNDFKGARLNSISETDEGLIVAYVAPENSPINSSPWYAFRLWSTDNTEAKTVRITYPEQYKHRYWPKISPDGKQWVAADPDLVKIAADTSYVEVKIEIPSDTIWIAAQPIVSSDDVAEWCETISTSERVTYKKAGKSEGKRKIPFLLISDDSPKNKEIIVLLSRQHPPEVTGYFALQAFLERILIDDRLTADFLDRYTILVYPLMNPDGADNGHWRHNLGGVDLNRDWAYYHQKETRTVANHIVKNVKQLKGKVALGLDFHSTWYDVYYTIDRDLEVINADFSDKWLSYIKMKIPGYEPHDAPSGLGNPVSKGWFVSQFNANGITYEIGDTTPTDFIKTKSETAAEGMMKVLLEQ